MVIDHREDMLPTRFIHQLMCTLYTRVEIQAHACYTLYVRNAHPYSCAINTKIYFYPNGVIKIILILQPFEELQKFTLYFRNIMM